MGAPRRPLHVDGPQQPPTELRLLQTLALALHEVADVDGALALVLREVCSATGWVLGQAWLPTANGTVLTCSPAWYHRDAALLPFRHASEALHLPPGVGLPGRAWATKQPVWSRDVTLDQHLPRGPVAAEVGLKAGMAIPVLAGQEVVAVLEFFVVDQRDEDEATVAMVATSAAQLGHVLQRKQVEAQLRSSEARLRAIVETAHDAIITIGADSVICSFNQGAERIFGYRAAEVIGQPLTCLMPERFRALHTAGVDRYLQHGEARVLGHTVEVAGQHRDGREVPLELTVSAMLEADATLFTGILRDITARKRLQAEREAVLAAEQEHGRRLRELAALKADFTAMIAHELNTPLAAIGMLARIVANDRLDPVARAHAAATIQTEVGLLRTLVADVQSAASVERDDFQVQLRPVPLSGLLADAAAFAATLPGDHPLAIQAAAGGLVLADPERIGQVLRNLLSNAAKYTPPGTPIELRAVHAGGQVRVEVADQGPGIHPDDRRRIFEKFGRGRDQAGRKVAGLGLGLYLSRRILQAHGSELTVQSTPGQGSIFAFALEVAS